MTTVHHLSNRQIAAYPTALATLVDDLTYKPKWVISLEDIDRGQGSQGLTLIVQTSTPDSYHPERTVRVNHYFPVPPAAYVPDSWQRWLFEQILLVERHEAMEFFDVRGYRPFAPNHGPGHDPYTVRELTTDEDRRTSFRGEVRP